MLGNHSDQRIVMINLPANLSNLYKLSTIDLGLYAVYLLVHLRGLLRR